LLETSSFVQTIEYRQGCKIACLEEIAFNQRWIEEDIRRIGQTMAKNGYGQYLSALLS
jgi:glucose-1-phosphate thymidylyltransferase